MHFHTSSGVNVKYLVLLNLVLSHFYFDIFDSNISGHFL